MLITVSLESSSKFSSIQSAIDSIPDDYKEDVIISIKNGTYYEKLFIDKNNIKLVGEDRYKTIITYDDYAKKTYPNGEVYRTFNSFSVYINGDDFEADNITFENSAGCGSVVGQAVAVYVNGDRAIFRNCSLLANQDTLFTGPLPPKPIEGNSFGGPQEGNSRRVVRHYFEDCFIRGDIDFIFGSATAVYKNCTIYSNDKNKDINGYITAASTPEGIDFGYVFINCKLISDAKENSVYLGRPWRDYAKTVFINTWMDKHIKEEGWHDWNKENARSTTFYAEYNSMGPGATMNKREPWAHILTENEAKKYTVQNVLKGNDNWDPENII